jgi:predicted metal-dependent hydrolase
MSFCRSLLLLVLLALALPSPVQAGDYELRITYTPGTREMRDGIRKNFAGLYEFSNRADYVAARDAFEDLDAKLIAFDNGMREDTRGTQEERYQRFLVRLQTFREASNVLKAALARAK